MARYVDGYVIPLPKKNLKAYQRMARVSCKVWMDHGALDYRECIGEDLDIQHTTPFPRQVRCKPGETVVFAWIEYKSRAHRDRVNARVMRDPRIVKLMGSQSAPFDGKRMVYGGFDVIVSA